VGKDKESMIKELAIFFVLIILVIAPFAIATLALDWHEKKIQKPLTHKDLKITVLGIFLLIFISWASISLYLNTPKQRLEAQLFKSCKILKIGMTLEQVVAIMGPIKQQHTNSEQKIDYYDFAWIGILPAPISVGVKDGRVVGIACGEDD